MSLLRGASLTLLLLSPTTQTSAQATDDARDPVLNFGAFWAVRA